MKRQPLGKPLPIILHMNELFGEPPSAQFSKDLEQFRTPKDHQLDVFTQGVLRFIRIANLAPCKREKYYGSQFYGLHFSNDLADLWNSSSGHFVKAHQVCEIAPRSWDYVYENDGHFALIYRGEDPSDALEKLLQGPTVIDCGMFCQLIFNLTNNSR